MSSSQRPRQGRAARVARLSCERGRKEVLKLGHSAQCAWSTGPPLPKTDRWHRSMDPYMGRKGGGEEGGDGGASSVALVSELVVPPSAIVDVRLIRVVVVTPVEVRNVALLCRYVPYVGRGGEGRGGKGREGRESNCENDSHFKMEHGTSRVLKHPPCPCTSAPTAPTRPSPAFARRAYRSRACGARCTSAGA